MSAYYNDNDPAAVAALEALMAEGFIAPGKIDSRSFKDSHQPGNSRNITLMMDLARTEPSGATLNGSSAPIKKSGAPNPEFAFWLMGYPDELISGVSRAMASFSRSRRRSSGRSAKRSTRGK